MSGSGSGFAALKKELKLLPSRLEATSMGDFYRSIQSFRDAFSLVDSGQLKDGEEKRLYTAAERISRWLDVYYQAWDLIQVELAASAKRGLNIFLIFLDYSNMLLR